jgi:hypothetical protein
MSAKALIGRIKGNKGLLGNPFAKNSAAGTTTATTTTGRFIIMDFCEPAKAYLVLAMLSLIYYVSTDEGITWLIIKALIFILWAFLLNKLCNSGNKAIAWLLAIIPQCILLIFTIKPSPAEGGGPSAMV